MTINTPWGAADRIKPVCEGVTAVYTPSHGGFYVEPEHLHRIPSHWRAASFNGQGKRGWFEEDCDWAMVALAFPDAFAAYCGCDKAEITEMAKQTMIRYYAELV